MKVLVFMLIWLVPVLITLLLNYLLGKSDACYEEFLRITKEEGDYFDKPDWRHECAVAGRYYFQEMTYMICFIPIFGLVMSIALFVFIVQAEIRYLIKKIRRK